MLDLTGENGCSKVVVGSIADMIDLLAKIAPWLSTKGSGSYLILYSGRCQ